MRERVAIGMLVNDTGTRAADNVSEVTLNALTGAFEGAGGRVVHVDKGSDLYESLRYRAGDMDIFFNISEGAPGSDGDMILRYLEDLSIPYTGAGISGMRIGDDKATTRQTLSGLVRSPRWQRFATPDDPLEDCMTYPLFVKPVAGAYSTGIDQDSIVSSEGELRMALYNVIQSMGQEAIVEGFLDGSEFNAGIIGSVVLPPLKCDLDELPGQPRARYEHVKRDYSGMFVPVLSEDVVMDLAVQTVNAHRAVGTQDYARCDFRGRRSEGEIPYFLEINTLPGLRPDMSASIAGAAASAGIPYDDMVSAILGVALERVSQDPRYAGRFAGKDTEGFDGAYGLVEGTAFLSGLEVETGNDVYHVLRPTEALYGVSRNLQTLGPVPSSRPLQPGFHVPAAAYQS